MSYFSDDEVDDTVPFVSSYGNRNERIEIVSLEFAPLPADDETDFNLQFRQDHELLFDYNSRPCARIGPLRKIGDGMADMVQTVFISCPRMARFMSSNHIYGHLTKGLRVNVHQQTFSPSQISFSISGELNSLRQVLARIRELLVNRPDGI
jgi:hypothetical protein